MIVLGITDSYTSGAALLADSHVVAAVNEERLTREKMAMGFPVHSIETVLDIAGLSMRDVDRVAVATEALFWRPEATRLPDYFRESKGAVRDGLLTAGAVFSRVLGDVEPARRTYYALKGALTRGRRANIRKLLARRWGYRGPIRFVNHHLAHAASAYYTSGFDPATVLTLDGAGDNSSGHVYRVEEGRFTLLKEISSYDSIGNYYAYVTHLCGFKAHQHEGKITGLAAFGEPRYLDLLRSFVRFENGSVRNAGRCFDRSAIRLLERRLGKNVSPADLAASVQALLEETVLALVRHWLARTNIPDLAVAGGVFANVKLNQRVHEAEAVRRIFVHPGMGDEGLAVGAAFACAAEEARREGRPFRPDALRDVYWGPSYSRAEAQAAAARSGLPYERPANVELGIARLLAAGAVVARFAGRMEYGPRALGNRSILYQPTDPSVNDWLNRKLRRTEFMPFAPVSLWEHAAELYRHTAGAEHTAEFMTITFDCTDTMRRLCPAVVHVDGTARPQLLRRDVNPSYYAILRHYHRLTGLPALINTSFNMHEEPIVCTPDDALRAFRAAKLDVLALEDLFVWSPETRFYANRASNAPEQAPAVLRER